MGKTPLIRDSYEYSLGDVHMPLNEQVIKILKLFPREVAIMIRPEHLSEEGGMSPELPSVPLEMRCPKFTLFDYMKKTRETGEKPIDASYYLNKFKDVGLVYQRGNNISLSDLGRNVLNRKELPGNMLIVNDVEKEWYAVTPSTYESR